MLSLKSKGTNLTILIATKNREIQLCRLLDSINQSTVLPKRIIIVYAGNSILHIKKKFENNMKITMIFSDISSQSYQKKLGICSMLEDEKWLLFLDDDVVLEKNTIENLVSKYIDNDNYNSYVGIGLAIGNQYIPSYNNITRKLLAFMKLYSRTPGTILSSGHAQTYLDQSKGCEVSWLNGISAWRSDVLFNYGLYDLRTDHSAYEDVIFSYTISKAYKLYYAPELRVSSQIFLSEKINNSSRFAISSFLRYFFVDTNSELSKYSLLYSQIFRSLDYVFREHSGDSMIKRIFLSIQIYFRLLNVFIFRKDIRNYLD